jgi:hypothetical protein
VATFAWNRWQGSTGISGNLRAEYAPMSPGDTTRDENGTRVAEIYKATFESG